MPYATGKFEDPPKGKKGKIQRESLQMVTPTHIFEAGQKPVAIVKQAPNYDLENQAMNETLMSDEEMAKYKAQIPQSAPVVVAPATTPLAVPIQDLQRLNEGWKRINGIGYAPGVYEDMQRRNAAKLDNALYNKVRRVGGLDDPRYLSPSQNAINDINQLRNAMPTNIGQAVNDSWGR